MGCVRLAAAVTPRRCARLRLRRQGASAARVAGGRAGRCAPVLPRCLLRPGHAALAGVGLCVSAASHPSVRVAPRVGASRCLLRRGHAAAAGVCWCVSAALRPSAGAASRAGASPLSVPSRPGASRAYLYYRMRATGRLLRACAPCGAYAVRFEGRLGPFWASKAEKSYIFTSFKLPPPKDLFIFDVLITFASGFRIRPIERGKEQAALLLAPQ